MEEFQSWQEFWESFLVIRGARMVLDIVHEFSVLSVKELTIESEIVIAKSYPQ